MVFLKQANNKSETLLSNKRPELETMLSEYLIATKSQLWRRHLLRPLGYFRAERRLAGLVLGAPIELVSREALSSDLDSEQTCERKRLVLSLIGSFCSQLKPLIEWVLSRTQLEHTRLVFLSSLHPACLLRRLCGANALAKQATEIVLLGEPDLVIGRPRAQTRAAPDR